MASLLPFAVIFLPVITIFVGIFAVLALSVTAKPNRLQTAATITLGLCLGELIYMRLNVFPAESLLYLWEDLPQAAIQMPFSFRFDGLAFLFSFLAIFVALIVVNLAHKDEEVVLKSGRFYILVLAIVLGGLSLYLADNTILFYFFWAFIGICAYFLVGLWPGDEESGQFAKKLIITVGAGGHLFLTLILLMAVRSGNFDFESLGVAADSPVTLLALLVAIMTLSSLYPLNLWLGAANRLPSSVSALLQAGVLVPSGIYLLVRFQNSLNGTIDPFWNRSLAFLGIASLVMGTYYCLRQRDAKALLAYDTTVQMGVVFLGFSIGTTLAMVAVMLHAVGFVLFRTGQLIHTGEDQTETSNSPKFRLFQTRGSWRRRFFGILVASNAGVPFTIGFFARWMLANAMIDAGHIFLALVLIGVNALTFGYAFLTPHLVENTNESAVAAGDSGPLSYLSGLLALLTILFGVAPFIPVKLLIEPALLTGAIDFAPLEGLNLFGLSSEASLFIPMATGGLILVSCIAGTVLLAFLLSDQFIEDSNPNTASLDDGRTEMPTSIKAEIPSWQKALNPDLGYRGVWRLLSWLAGFGRSVIAPLEQKHYVATVLFVVLGMILVLID